MLKANIKTTQPDQPKPNQPTPHSNPKPNAANDGINRSREIPGIPYQSQTRHQGTSDGRRRVVCQQRGQWPCC